MSALPPVAARSADPDIDPARAGAGERDVAGDVEPAGAAAAGERLGDDAARPVALRRRRDQILIDGAAGDRLVDVGDDRAGNAAGSAGAADADADVARARAGQSDSARDVEGARAAAAADRLGEDRVAVVAFGMRASEHVEIDVAGGSAAAARAADADVDPDRPGARRVERAGDVEAARAAAAADALRDDRAGLVAVGRGNARSAPNRPTAPSRRCRPSRRARRRYCRSRRREKLSPPVTLNAPAPPPPPTDWAVKPADWSPCVVTDCALASTQLEPPPPPPDPPRPTPIEPLATPPTVRSPLMLNAPAPPPPPADWTRMPRDWSPSVSTRVVDVAGDRVAGAAAAARAAEADRHADRAARRRKRDCR